MVLFEGIFIFCRFITLHLSSKTVSLGDRPINDFEHHELTNLIEFKSAFVHLAEKMWILQHCLWIHKSHLNTNFNINLGLTALFIYLKIILLQYF